jgi:hypothetical protein
VGGGPLPLSDVFSGPSLSVTSDGRPVVAVRGPNEGTTAIIDVLEFDGTSWVPIGPTIRAERVFTPIALAITPDGTPFVGFSTTFTTLTARVVLRFDGTSWVGTGPVLVPGGMAFQGVQTLTVSPLDGVPHSISSFFDFALGQDRRAVVRWTGNEWLPLTQTGYRIGNENPGVETKLEISQAGIPFVLYQNEIGGFTVKQFIEE